MNSNKTIITSNNDILLQLAIIWLILAITSCYDYLLFHSVAEVFIVATSLGIFFLTWNTRHYFKNGYFVIISSAYLLIAFLALLHALAFKDMGVFVLANDANLTTQLWLITRYFTAISFLIAPFFAEKKLNINLIILIYFIVFILTFISIFLYNIFPSAYVDGLGLTAFTKISEYILICIFIAATTILYFKRKKLDKGTYKIMTIAMILAIITEILSVVYFQISDIFNLIGHFTLITSTFLIYSALIEISLTKPYEILADDFKLKENALREKTVDLKKFQLALASAFDPVIITDAKGNIIFANPASEKLTGYSREEMIGKTPLLWNKDLINENESLENYYKNTISQIKEERPGFFNEVRNIKKNGQKYIADLHVSSINDEKENPIFYVLIERDITKLKEIDQIKTDFISMASHQLRTPLSSISLSSELLLRQGGETMNPEHQEYVKEIFASTQKMSQLITDLLTITKKELSVISEGEKQFSDLIEFTKEILNKLKPQIDVKKIRLSENYSNHDIKISFNRNEMETIIKNIMINSIQYTPQEGEITVSVSKNQENVIIKICDTGCGIPQDQINNIFDKFFRTRDAEEINFNGSGLGLYIVKSFIDRMGGKIWVDSKTGIGTTVNIWIPG